MSLATRVIACLDVHEGRVTKGVQFLDNVDVGDPVALARAYDRVRIDELVFYDITASAESRGSVVDVIEKTGDQVFIPFTVGGGVRSVGDFDVFLRAGADKVSVNSGAVSDPKLQAAQREAAGQLWNEEDWVFAGATGGPLNPSTDYHEWKRLVAAAGLRDSRLHDARHTAATVLLLLGVTERAAMGIMGWSSSGMAKRYQHITDPIRLDVAQRVNGLIWQRQPEPDTATED